MDRPTLIGCILPAFSQRVSVIGVLCRRFAVAVRETFTSAFASCFSARSSEITFRTTVSRSEAVRTIRTSCVPTRDSILSIIVQSTEPWWPVAHMGPSNGRRLPSVQWALPSNNKTKVVWSPTALQKKNATKNKSPNIDFQRLKCGVSVV